MLGEDYDDILAAKEAQIKSMTEIISELKKCLRRQNDILNKNEEEGDI